MEDTKLNIAGKFFKQVAIVTGGGSGIGRATCEALYKEGANIVIADINQEEIQKTLDALCENGNTNSVMSFVVDVRDEEQIKDLVSQTTEKYGRIDILVHSAGILRGKGGTPKIMEQISTDEMNNVIDTNLKGTFLCNRAVLSAMIKQKSGKIINISSTSGQKGRAFDSVYCASKFGVIGLSESLAEEVRQYGIKVQTVLPDAVDTPLWNQNGPIRAPENSLSPERISDLIVYLLALPEDTILKNVVISPFRFNKRKRRSKPKNETDA
jgi:Short-chain alcohol dehydrogenase of unknown specificity